MLDKLREWMAGICPAADWSTHEPQCPVADGPCDAGCEWELVDHGYVMKCKLAAEQAAPVEEVPQWKKKQWQEQQAKQENPDA